MLICWLARHYTLQAHQPEAVAWSPQLCRLVCTPAELLLCLASSTDGSLLPGLWVAVLAGGSGPAAAQPVARPILSTQRMPSAGQEAAAGFTLLLAGGMQAALCPHAADDQQATPRALTAQQLHALSPVQWLLMALELSFWAHRQKRPPRTVAGLQSHLANVMQVSAGCTH